MSSHAKREIMHFERLAGTNRFLVILLPIIADLVVVLQAGVLRASDLHSSWLLLSSSGGATATTTVVSTSPSNNNTIYSGGGSSGSGALLMVDPFLNQRHQPYSMLSATNPIWPKKGPPTLRSNCRVKFIDPDMRACHILPWGEHSNFGDELGPSIVKRILELSFGCSADGVATFNIASLGGRHTNRSFPCFMTVGSLWRMVKTGDHIWGAGVAHGNTVKKRCQKLKRNELVTEMTLYSSRGPLSAKQISQHFPWAANLTIPSAGDAGVLIPYLFPEYVLPFSAFARAVWNHDGVNVSSSRGCNNNDQYCLIPHHDERGNNQFQRVKKGKVLTVMQSWENMTLALQECCKVVSSSLHGVILAETLGIPSRRLTLTKQPGDFKFSDFYMSYRGYEPEPARNTTAALADLQQPLSATKRDAYARRVLETFPFHLFQVETP